jgi:MFS family permease
MLFTAISAAAATLVALLIVTDVIHVWMLYPLAAIEGFGDAVNQPARQVMIYDVVGPEDLPNAVAVNSLGSNTMRIVGPSLAGGLIGAFGIQSAFVLQAAAYGASVYATSRIRTKGTPTKRSSASVFESMAEGLSYARRHRDVLLLVVMAGLPSLLVYPYVQYIPAIRVDVCTSSNGSGSWHRRSGTARLSGR